MMRAGPSTGDRRCRGASDQVRVPRARYGCGVLRGGDDQPCRFLLQPLVREGFVSATEDQWDGIPKSICEVLLDVLVEFGLHAQPPRGIEPPPLVVALYEAAAAYYAPMETLESRCLFEARLFLASIASAQPLGTMEQSEWMIEQAREGQRRASVMGSDHAN
jgi:hypothetical protein